jgi:hypothetical protein
MLVSPNLVVALEQLDILLDDYNYAPRSRTEIASYIKANGTIEGCPMLDDEDRRDAEMVLEAEFPEIPFDSPAWDKPDVFLDVEMLAAGTHPLPFGDGPDAPDADPAIHFAGIASLAERMGIAPISGGSPEYSDQDHADHMAWLDSLDAGHPPDDRAEPTDADLADVAAAIAADDARRAANRDPFA